MPGLVSMPGLSTPWTLQLIIASPGLTGQDEIIQYIQDQDHPHRISNIQTDKDGTVLGKGYSIYVYIPTIYTVYIIPRSIPITLIISYQCIVY